MGQFKKRVMIMAAAGLIAVSSLAGCSRSMNNDAVVAEVGEDKIVLGVANFYARMQHITPRYFSAIIKEKTGDSALQWIVRMVITEAKQLLEESDLSIKEIADQLNFPTQSFFGKYFKQYV